MGGITLSLPSRTLKTNYRLISRFHRERSLSSLSDLEKTLLRRSAISLAENMETIRLDHIIISQSSDFLTAEDQLLAILETINPAVTYARSYQTLGD